MYKIVILISLLLFTSCEKEEIKPKAEKKDFNIETRVYSDFDNIAFLNKTGKISSSQDIKVSTNASGRVSKIYIKQGETIYKGNKIAVLEDNISDYGLNLERARNNLEKAKLNYKTTENSLNKNISDLKINLENLKIDESGSKSSFELEKIENSIQKLALDYDNLKIGNIQIINGYSLSIGKEINTLSLFLDDIIDFSDILVGVTDKNRSKNDSFENFLGAKDRVHKSEVKALLQGLIKYKESNIFDKDYSEIKIEEFGLNIDDISKGYNLTTNFLVELEKLIDNSIISNGFFSEIDKSGYKTSINAYQTRYTLSNGAFLSLKNTINTFLETYQNSEESLLKQIGLLESDKKIFIKGLDISLNIDQSTLAEAISNKDLTLQNLERLIIDTEISEKQARKQYDKLIIRSPISGVAGEVLVDLGQEINIGTPIASISGVNNNEVLISFSRDELDFVSVGSDLSLDFNGKSYTGTISSISKTADSNLKHVSRVSFKDSLDLIGNIVSVKAPIFIQNSLLPINVVKIKESGIGTVNLFDLGKIIQKDVNLGEIYGDKIEILSGLEDTDIIIMNYIGNYDEEKFELKIK